ncbi:MAG: hypothetical protein AB2A00_06610 [Myxococcota bacterium]
MGEKCTWITVSETLGHVGCAADGVVPRGGACTYGEPGETTGFDDCQGGHVCIAGLCQEVCTLAPDDCQAGTICNRYGGLFGEEPKYGACDFQCNPVTQVRLLDAAANCGVADGSRACYMSFNDENGICVPVPQQIQANPGDYQQDDIAFGPPGGGAYLNGCAPGYAPLLRSSQDTSAPIICVAYCQPAETHSGNTAGAGGTAPYSCANRGALTHECKYFWTFEDTPTTAHDTLGFCWTPENYTSDWDGDGNAEPYPRCTSLPDSDTDGDGTPEHLFYGCGPAPAP